VTAEAAQELAVVHSSVYRLITWISGLNELKVNAATKEQRARMDDVRARLTKFAERPDATDEERKLTRQALVELEKYRKSVTSAIDLSSDTLTGATAMQIADGQFQGLMKDLDALVQAEKRMAQDSYAAATAAFRMALSLLLAITLAAFVLSGGLAVFMSRRIVRPLHSAIATAREIAGGNLAMEVKVGGKDETGQLLRALGQMTHSLRELVGQVAGGARSVAETSAQIAQGNLDLSQRTEEQAGTLEETASSMEELTATVTQNAETARNASQLAQDASQVARQGGEVVGQVVSTMTGISESSRKIGDIIGVIDGIAFQTNILALNAAVEAARAGEQGRGFAVVAAEVRSLAQRSAAAAKEIKGLIGESVDKVEAGTRLVDAAGRTMGDIVQSVQRVSDLIAEIAAASQEQSSGIEQVNRAVTHMDQAVQHNASLVEEAAAATTSMKDQAAALLEMVSRFQLAAAPRVPQAREATDGRLAGPGGVALAHAGS
jgi:methyl-accepting chemotaxis protein